MKVRTKAFGMIKAKQLNYWNWVLINHHSTSLIPFFDSVWCLPLVYALYIPLQTFCAYPFLIGAFYYWQRTVVIIPLKSLCTVHLNS